MSVSKEVALDVNPFESRRAPFAGGELSVSFPFSVHFPGSTHRLTVQTDLLGNLVRRSSVFPLKNIAFLEPEHPAATDEKTTPFRRVVRYSSQRGGNLMIYLGSIWQVAEDYTQGNLINRLGPLKASSDWQDWVSSVETRIKDYPGDTTALGYQKDGAAVARLWPWLTTDILVTYATLTHLSTDEALFKKLFADIPTVALIASLSSTSRLLGFAGLNPVLGVGIAFGDFYANRRVSNKLEKKIQDIEDQMFYYASQIGPLVGLA